MTSRPKKQADIVIIGKGSLVNGILSLVSHSHTNVLHIADASKVHFLSKGVMAHGGERIAARRFLLVIPNRMAIPEIRGMELTKYNVLKIGIESSTTKDDVIVLGGGELAVNAALAMASTNNSVSLVYAGDTLLPDYDISVQDVISRQLKKLKVKILPQYTPIASITKAGKTKLLVKNSASSKELQCDNFFIEPNVKLELDIGLSNYGYIDEGESNVSRAKDLTIIHGDKFISNVEDAECYSKILKGKRSTRPMHILDTRSNCGNVEYFSFGVLEQQFMDTHIGYKKSIAKLQIPDSDMTGFIKVLVSLKRKVVGISGIVPKDYAGIEVLRFAVKNHIKMTDLAKQIDLDDTYLSTYLEVLRETK